MLVWETLNGLFGCSISQLVRTLNLVQILAVDNAKVEQPFFFLNNVQETI
jgi:hypothetical protein